MDPMRFSYYADLRSIVLDENGRGWIQAMRVGEYNHPRYGKLSFTLDRLYRFAESVKQRVRGIDPDVDYDHKMDPVKGREAAGWVKDAKVESNSLWLLVDWTQSAATKIKEGAYRYFSPEFQDHWTDAGGKMHQDVLFGGGITNRPFLKDLLPLNLSELSFADNHDKEEGVDPKKLRASLGLPEDATEEQVLQRAGELHQQSQTHGSAPVDHTATTHAPNQPAGAPTTVNGVPNDATTAAQRIDKDGNAITGNQTPFDKQLSELAATNPVVKMLMEQQAAQAKMLAELQQTNKVNGIKVKLSEYSTGNKIVAPVVLSEAEKLLSAIPEPLHALVHTVLDKVRDGHGTVQLGEIGTSGPAGNTRTMTDDPIKDVDAAVKKMLSEDKELTSADAYVQYFLENPDKFAEYQSASYAFRI